MKKYLPLKSFTIKSFNYILIVIALYLLFPVTAYTQGINPVNSANAASAILDLDAINQGILIPRF